MPSTKVPKPTHVRLDPKTGKYHISRRDLATPDRAYDTLQEALEAASRGKP
jgi:hypothetical protein